MNDLDQSNDANDSAEDSFQNEVAGIVPIPQDKVPAAPRSLTPTEAQLAARKAAQRQMLLDQNTLTEEYVEMVDPNEPLSFQRAGVQHGVFRKLRLGQYEADATLDLHAMTVRDARNEVFQFINEALRHDLRCVKIVHGKGERSNPPALLKSYTARWLVQLDAVLAYHSALRHLGGVGAVYVLLHKSERKKQENRERHLSRRG
ncbi:Smr-like protein [gamma proteobacterium HdN1]|nr:Smr-like protein [gamma proteobacterium HdN1]